MQVETILREVPLADFVSKLIDGDMNCYAVIAKWAHRISEIMGIGNTPPQSLARIPGKGEYAFGKDETIAAPASDFLLFRIQSGNLNLFGLEDFTIGHEYGYIVAGSDLWFQCASEEIEIDVLILGMILPRQSTQFCHPGACCRDPSCSTLRRSPMAGSRAQGPG